MEQRMPLGLLAERLGGRLSDPSQADVVIEGVRSLDTAGPGDLAFLWNPAYAAQAVTSGAGAIVTRDPIPGARAPALLVADPQAAMLALLGEVHALRHPAPPPGVHPDASVADDVVLGAGASVGPGAVIEAGTSVGAGSHVRGGAYVGRGVTIGEGAVIHPHATILDHCRLGDRVIVWPNTVIGKDGFGFVQNEHNQHSRIPQIGTVVIEDDVEVGSLCTVDRGALEDTVLHRGVKVDSHCHVAHGCVIGENAMLVGGTRMGGSVSIGKNAYLLQNAGVSTGRKVGEGAILGTCTHVLHKDVEPAQTMLGCPARPAMQARRIENTLARLPEMRARLRMLEKRVEALG